LSCFYFAVILQLFTLNNPSTLMIKQSIFACLIFLTSLLTTQGQSTTILPGILLPQMTTAQRTAIASPQNGMLVFDTDTQSYWFRQSGLWVNLSAGGNNYWQLSGAGGNEIKNTNTGGFWSVNPTGLTINSNNTTNPPTAPVSGAGTRLMWIPSRSAFRAGTVGSTGSGYWDAANIGLFSFATGYNTRALGSYSTAMGNNTSAGGNSSAAIGNFTTANGDYSTAMGEGTTASGSFSTAMGEGTTAGGLYSMAMGYTTNAGGTGSTAMGGNTGAGGSYSTAMGNNTSAGGNYSTAMGNYTIATGTYSTAMGGSTNAGGNYSTAMGYTTNAGGFASTAMGYGTFASGIYSTAMGNLTTASGNYSTAMGVKVNTNLQEGSFMIGDSDPLAQGVTPGGVANQFVARFANGYYLMTSGNSGNGTPSDNVRTGIRALPGSNAWSAISDSTKKEKLLPIDGEGLLHKISKFRLTTWNYKGQDPKVFRHYGPMAQDFYAAFGQDGLGTIGCDTLINQADFDGINFTAIQALVKRTEELKSSNEELRTKNEALEDRLAKMEKEWAELRQMLEPKITAKNTATAK
jgi:hypothetical protein